MCGLFGAISSLLTKEEVDFVGNLGYLSRFRGGDSTGIAIVNQAKKKFQVGLRKQAIPSGVFFDTKDTYDFVQRYDKPTLIIGHTRAATVGSMSELNAHPFHFGNIVGAHNGQMDAFKDYPTDNRPERSDSNLFFETLSKSNLKEALEQANKGTTCAYALTWYDMKQGTFNIIRNDKRPLYLMLDGSGTTTYWASETDFLKFLDVRTLGTHFRAPFSTQEDHLYTFGIGDNKFTQTKMTVAKSYPVHNYPPNAFGYSRSYNYDNYDTDRPDEWEDGSYRAVGEVAPWQQDLEAWELDPNHPNPKHPNLERQRAQRLHNKEQGDRKESTVITLPNLSAKPRTNNPAFSNLADGEMVYVGYRDIMTPVAKQRSYLRSLSGCFMCDTKAVVNEKIFWKSTTEYACYNCYTNPLLKLVEGPEGIKMYSESFIIKVTNAERYVKDVIKAKKEIAKKGKKV